MSKLDKIGQEIASDFEIAFAPQHEYQRVNPNDFGHLNLKFYEQTRSLFLQKGCQFLGDVEDVTLKGTSMDMRTFIRFLVSKEGTTSIGLYHPKPKLFARILLWISRQKIGQIVDCESELSDGTYIVTSNAEMAGTLDSPPTVLSIFLPANTPPEEVYKIHLEKIKSYLDSNASTTLTTMRAYNDVLLMQHRLANVKYLYRKKVGITETEIKRFGANEIEAQRIKAASDKASK